MGGALALYPDARDIAKLTGLTDTSSEPVSIAAGRD